MIRQQQGSTRQSPNGDCAVPLADDALDDVVAGMDCRTAIAVSSAYQAAGSVMSGLGDNQMASYFYGRASGVIEAGCPK